MRSGQVQPSSRAPRSTYASGGPTCLRTAWRRWLEWAGIYRRKITHTAARATMLYGTTIERSFSPAFDFFSYQKFSPTFHTQFCLMGVLSPIRNYLVIPEIFLSQLPKPPLPLAQEIAT